MLGNTKLKHMGSSVVNTGHGDIMNKKNELRFAIQIHKYSRKVNKILGGQI